MYASSDLTENLLDYEIAYNKITSKRAHYIFSVYYFHVDIFHELMLL